MEEMLGSEPIPTPSSPVSVLHTFSSHFEADNASFAQHANALGGDNARAGNTWAGSARAGNALAGESDNSASVALQGTAVMGSASGGDSNSGAVDDGGCNGVSSGGFSSLAVRVAARRRERMHSRLSARSQLSAAESLAGGTPTPRSHSAPSVEAAEVATVAELWRRCREPVPSQPGAMIDSLELELLHQERVRRAQALFAHLDSLIGSDGASSRATAGTHRNGQPMAAVLPTWKEMAPKAFLDVPDNCCYESYCHRLV